MASTLAGKLNKSLSRLGRGFKEIWELHKREDGGDDQHGFESKQSFNGVSLR